MSTGCNQISVSDEIQNSLRIVFKLSESPEDSGGYINLKNGSTLRLYGSTIPVIWDIQESLNFSLEMYFHDWTPALEFVANGTLSWGAPLMSLSEGMVKQGLNAGLGLDFLHPLVLMPSNIYFRPPLTEYIHSTILRPFIIEVWASFFACIFISTILVYKINLFIEKVDISSEHKWKDHHEHDPKTKTSSHVFLQMIQFMRGRYFHNELHRIQTPPSLIFSVTRNLHCFQYLGILVATSLSSLVVIIYTAKIAAIFARNENDVKSPEDLIKFGYTMSSYSDFHFERIFKNPKKVRQLFERKFMGGTDATRKVVAPGKKDPRFAFLTHPDAFHVEGQHILNFTYELCSVSSFASRVKTPQSMYLTKGSPYRERINVKIVQLLERGLNYRYQANYRKQFEYNCDEHNFLAFTSLSNTHLSFAFVLLMVGASVAVLIEIFIQVIKLFYPTDQLLMYKLGTRRRGNSIRLLPL